MSLSVQQLFTWWRTRKKDYLRSLYSKDNEQKDMSKLAKAIFSWLGSNYKLIYKKGNSLSWLSISQQSTVDSQMSSKSDLPIKSEDEISVGTSDTTECNNCKKDLIDILIHLLSEGVDFCTQNQIQGKTNLVQRVRKLSNIRLYLLNGGNRFNNKLFF